MSLLSVDNIQNSAGNGTPNFPFGAPGELSVPLRLFASTTPDAKLTIGPSETQDSLGGGRAAAPINGTTLSFPQTQINFQTGALSGGGTVNGSTTSITLPTVTTGQYVRAGFTISASSSVTVTFSSGVASYAALPDPATVMAAGQLQIGWVDLQATGPGAYKSADATSNVIQNAVSGSPRIHKIVNNNKQASQLSDLSDVSTADAADGLALVYSANTSSWAPGGAGDTSFKLASVTSPNALLKGGSLETDDGRVLVSGSGTTSTTTGVDLTVNLTTILGSSPATSTTYWLYIDSYSLGSAVTLTDNGRIVYNVAQSNLKLLTVDPTQVSPARYYVLGSFKTDGSGNWANAATAPYRRQPIVGAYFQNGPFEFTQSLTTNGSFVLSHGLQGIPQITNFYYFDGSQTKQVDGASVLQDKNSATITVSTVGLTLTGSQSLTVEAFYVPRVTTNFSMASRFFATPWLTSTATTQIAHGLSDMEDIRGYIVQQWDLSGGSPGVRRNVDPAQLVSRYDNTNFYLDWSSLSPSATNQYRVISGGAVLPAAVPTFIGGYTKFVGFGPGSYASLTAALAASGTGDSILVTNGYTISAPEVVSISGIKIGFLPNIVITVTGGARAIDIQASDVTVNDARWLITAASNLTDGVRINGSDNVLNTCKLEINNASQTVTNVFNVAGGSRNAIFAGIKVTAGNYTNKLTDAGTATGGEIRG